jgi:hypothetical protein
MKFSEYLQEKNNSSVIMLTYIDGNLIPISPKFFEEVFGEKTGYCFRAIHPTEKDLKKLFSRQNKKSQVSAFMNYKKPSFIFYGATDMTWGSYYSQNTIIAVLKGKSTIRTPEDSWSVYDKQGRKWIQPVEYIQNYNGSKVGKVFDKILSDIRELKRGIGTNPAYLTNDLSAEDLNKYKQQYIKKYIDGAYDIIKTHKDELLNAIQKDKIQTYDEILCYDYKVIELIHITPTYTNKAITAEDAEKMAKKYNVKYTNIKYTEDAEAIIKKYKGTE